MWRLWLQMTYTLDRDDSEDRFKKRYSDRSVMKYLNFTEEQIAENERMWAEENAPKLKLKKHVSPFVFSQLMEAAVRSDGNESVWVQAVCRILKLTCDDYQTAVKNGGFEIV